MKKIRISDEQITFECDIDDIKAIGRVAMTISYS
ncbi:hypothetical protein [Pectobacterium parvum]